MKHNIVSKFLTMFWLEKIYEDYLFFPVSNMASVQFFNYWESQTYWPGEQN